MSASDTSGYTLFSSALGACGLAWRGPAIVAAALPDDEPDRTRARLAKRAGAPEAEPPGWVREVIAGIVALLDGEDVDFGAVPVDLSRRPAFDREVLALTRAIPRGTTRTYGALAADLGDPRLARQVGQALGHNPIPIVVPCHRVVGADDRLVGFSAPGGIATKRRLLALEGVWPGGPTLFDHFGVEPG